MNTTSDEVFVGSAVPAEAPATPSRNRVAAVRAWGATNRLEVGFILVGLLARIAFWQVSERKFEDGLITVTHARSLVDGHGFTHHPFEEATHGFTSAISVSVPGIGEVLGFLPLVDGFLVLRLASLLAFVVTIVAASAILERLGVKTWGKVFAYAILALSFNHIFYGMGGMETQISVAILLSAVWAGMARKVVASGVLYGVCILARPDFVLFVGIGVLWWLLQDRPAALRVAGLAALTIAPWVIFTTIYFGSPIPNTIPAKSLRYQIPWPDTLAPGDWWDFIALQVGQRESWLWRTFSPFWEHVFVSDAPVLQTFAAWVAGGVLALGVAGMIALRGVSGFHPALAFIVVFFAYRLLALPATYYDWYYPPLTALLALCGAVALQRLSTLAPRATAVMASVAVAAFLWAFVPLTVLESRYQHDVEDKARLPLGIYLRDQVPKGSVVTSESAGYVGFYSAGNIKLWDYPGLTSKEAFRIMEALGASRNNLQWLVHAALPDYAIWRPDELESFAAQFPQSAALYEEAMRVKAAVTEEDLRFWGVQYALPDDEFIVMRRVRGRLGGEVRAERLAAADDEAIRRARGGS